MASRDPFAKVRKQARAALEQVAKEISRREAELERLQADADRWRVVLGAGSKPTRRSATRRLGAKRGGGKRLNWDNVVKGLPKTFTVDDVMKRPGVKARGREQVYPSLQRMIESKKVKRVGPGRYQRV